MAVGSGIGEGGDEALEIIKATSCCCACPGKDALGHREVRGSGKYLFPQNSEGGHLSGVGGSEPAAPYGLVLLGRGDFMLKQDRNISCTRKGAWPTRWSQTELKCRRGP